MLTFTPKGAVILSTFLTNASWATSSLAITMRLILRRLDQKVTKVIQVHKDRRELQEQQDLKVLKEIQAQQVIVT